MSKVYASQSQLFHCYFFGTSHSTRLCRLLSNNFRYFYKFYFVFNSLMPLNGRIYLVKVVVMRLLLFIMWLWTTILYLLLSFSVFVSFTLLPIKIKNKILKSKKIYIYW